MKVKEMEVPESMGGVKDEGMKGESEEEKRNKAISDSLEE